MRSSRALPPQLERGTLARSNFAHRGSLARAVRSALTELHRDPDPTAGAVGGSDFDPDRELELVGAR